MKQPTSLTLDVIEVENPQAKNFIFGQSHFIKTVEDLYECIYGSMPSIQFGIAFCEASGDTLIRTAGTNQDMIHLAVQNAKAVSCGHTFFIFLDNAFPINILKQVQHVPEVVNIYCATANPVEVIIGRTSLGGAILGVVDGKSPSGIETQLDRNKRIRFLRKIGYKQE